MAQRKLATNIRAPKPPLREDIEPDSLRRYVQVCHMPMTLFNLHSGLMEFVNKPFADLLGYSPEELIGRSPAVLHADGRAAEARVQASIRTLLDEGTVHVERELRQKSGAVMSCDLHGSLMTRTPTPLAVMVIRDITAQRQAERDLRQMAARFTAVVENMPAGVVFAERRTGFLMHANKHAAELLGRRIEPGQGFDSYVSTYGLEREDGSPYATEELPIPRVVRTGQRVYVDDLFVRRPDGTRIQMEVWAGPVCDPAEEGFDAVVALFQDITQRKANERLLHAEQQSQRELQEQLHRDEKARSIATLAGGVAHDFNNILVSVLGNASMIHSELPPDHEWYKPISSIIHSAERAAAITHRLLAYSRGGAFELQRVSLKNVLTDSLSLCRSAVPRQVEIHFDAQAADDIVEVDTTQMQQVLLNLTLNAAEAMPHGGAIWISTSSCVGPQDSPLVGKPCVCLKGRDEGAGVDPGHVSKLFEPFFTTKEFGRGLGLASVYGMLKNHGALIRLTSARQEPAEFSIYFPLKQPSPCSNPC